MKQQSLPSEKYKKQLLTIKRQLMKEIASYLVYDKFSMAKETVIDYLTDYSVFTAKFDTIRGCEHNLRLYLETEDNTHQFLTVLGFDDENYTNAEKDIPFLISLLDYVDMDSRKVREKS